MTKLKDILNETNYGKQKLNELSDEAYIKAIQAAKGRGGKQQKNIEQLALYLIKRGANKGKAKDDVDKEAIRTWLVSKNITNFKLNSDGTVDVNGDVRIVNEGLSRFPVKFGKVSGDFICAFNVLKTLEGAPKSVGGNFNCAGNYMKTLEGSPKTVGGDFDCSGRPSGVNGPLKSLKGGPQKVGGDFIITNQEISKDQVLDSHISIGGEIYIRPA